LRPGTFLSVVEDLIDSTVRAGFTNVLVLNGHGGNIVPCQAVWDQFVRRTQVNLQFLSYFELLSADDTDLLTSGQEIPTHLPGHAQEFETAVAMAAFPENVRRGALGDQDDPTPAMATAATGAEYLHRIETRLVTYLREMIDGTRVADIPPFHP
jgi:creatinine amidohydrolase